MTRSKVGNLGAVVFEDWLVKSPPFAKIHNPQSWHRRYFVLLQINHKNQYTVQGKLSKKGPKSVENLHDMYLVYWEKKSDMKKGVKPIRTIPLLKGYTVDIRQPPFFETKFHHVLLLDTVERKYYLCADDEEKKQNWLHALLKAIQSGQEAQSTGEENTKEPIYEVIQSLLTETGDTESLSSQSTSSSNRISSCSSISDITDFELRNLNPSSGPPTSDDESYYESMSSSSFNSIPDDNITRNTRSLPPRNRVAAKTEKSFKTPSNANADEFVVEVSPVMNFGEPMYCQVDPNEFVELDEGKNVENKDESSPKTMKGTTNNVSSKLRTVQFFDLALEIPVSSTIEFSDNTLRVITPKCTCVVSMKKKRGVSFT